VAKGNRLKLILLLLLLLVSSGVASAAGGASRARLDEVSSGECLTHACFGYTLQGPANGDLPGSLTLTLNYSPPSFTGNTVNQVNGYWVLDSSTTDSLFGSITGGTIDWNGAGKAARLDLTLTVQGGFGIYQDATGSGDFSGRLHNPNNTADWARGVLTIDGDW
jgi:hypothetical protein